MKMLETAKAKMLSILMHAAEIKRLLLAPFFSIRNSITQFSNTVDA